jgi:hypothetical protein
MSQFYDLASLVVIPSGYRASTIYAQKPLTTDGQLSFTRASGATRVGPNGLIEEVRTNLALQSQTLSVSPTWTAYSGTTVTANAVTAPDGTLTAEQITGTSGSFRGIRQAISSSAIPHTFSVYLRSATGSSTTARIWVDGTNTTVTVTTSWQRFTVTGTTAASFEVQISTAVSSAIDVYAWGAQLETGDIATAYIPTTTAAVSVGPVNNVPRLDYLGSSCPRLLLEPQRTNLITNSENIGAANWTNYDSTDALNVTATLDPSGYNGADKLQETTANALHYIAFQNNLMAAANSYTFSAFLKAAERNWVNLYIYDGSSSYNAYFNLATGIKGSVTSGASSTIQSYGNGWYRCSVTRTFGGSSLANGGVITATADGTISYTGTTGSGLYLWGAQLEAGAYATSYIPTLAASVTRVADAASKTGISSLIGQTEGTLFVEFNAQDSTGAGQAIATIYENSSNVIILYKQNDNILKCFVVTAGTLVADLGSVTVSGNVKMAIAYKANDFALYINGTQRGVDTAGAVPACSNLYLGADDGGAQKMTGKVSQTLLFKTRLTNAQLAELTAL